jgi:hypothetical protein
MLIAELHEPTGALPYCHAAGHAGGRTAAARDGWCDAWRACFSLPGSLENGENGENSDGDCGHQSGERGGGEEEKDGAPAPRTPPSDQRGASPVIGRLALNVEWRPMTSDVRRNAAPPPLDALGFALTRRDGRAASQLHGGALPYPAQPRTADGGGGRTAPAQHARAAVGGWWEGDALALCRWNALLCSCTSLDDVPHSRLRRLLGGGVPFQHRLHVWTACCGAANRRAAYDDVQRTYADALAAAAQPKHDDESSSAPDASPPHPSPQSAAEAACAAHDAAKHIIEKDLLRTFPTHPCLNAADAPLVAPLRRVLRAFAWHDRETSYCQVRVRTPMPRSRRVLSAALAARSRCTLGSSSPRPRRVLAACVSLSSGSHRVHAPPVPPQGLNFIGAMLLLHGDEAGSFALLSAMCTQLLPGYHVPHMAGLHAAQAALIATVRDAAPLLHAQLEADGVASN